MTRMLPSSYCLSGQSRGLLAGEGGPECSQVLWVQLDLGAAHPSPLCALLRGVGGTVPIPPGSGT